MLWKPHGILDEAIVKEIVAFIDVVEERASKPFNRFADLSALDMVDLNFKFVYRGCALTILLKSRTCSCVQEIQPCVPVQNPASTNSL